MSHRSLKLTSVFLAVWTTLCLAKELTPGVILKHKTEFLSLIHKDFLEGEFLKEKLNKTLIPDQNGNLPTFAWSKVDYILTDITLEHFEQPEVQVDIKPHKDIILTVEVPKITLSAKHELELKTGNWTLHKVSGNLSMSIVGAKLTMSREVVISKESKERVIYISHNCTAVIKDVYLEFSDSLSESIGGRIYSEILRKEVADSLCNASTYLTEYEVNFEHNRTEEVFLDMTLLVDPQIQDTYVEFHHRGEIRSKNDNSSYTDWPETTIAPHKSEAMVDCGISNWTLNTLGAAIFKQKMFDYNYTEDDLSDDRKHLLNTTCVGDCFGTLFPNVSKLHPNKKVEIDVSLLQEPLLEIDETKLKLNLKLNITTYVVNANKPLPKEELFSASLELSANTLPIIDEHKLAFELERPVNWTLTVLSSNVGHLPEESVKAVFAQALVKEVIPFYKSLKTKGFKLTSILGFNIEDSRYEMSNGTFWFSMNLKEKN